MLLAEEPGDLADRSPFEVHSFDSGQQEGKSDGLRVLVRELVISQIWKENLAPVHGESGEGLIRRASGAFPIQLGDDVIAQEPAQSGHEVVECTRALGLPQQEVGDGSGEVVVDSVQSPASTVEPRYQAPDSSLQTSELVPSELFPI